MKRIIVYIILAFINKMLFWCKIKENKITFISYKSNKLEKDFKLISKKLEKENKYNLVYILIKYENNFGGNIAYLFNCIKQIYHINTSKVVILDYNNFVVSHFKKKEVKVIQVWHASGAIKKFGNDIEREYPIKNYDYVISTSSFWKGIYSTAFNVSKDNVLPLGIPRTDSLFNKKRLEKYKKSILEKYPEIKNKKVVLYAPTFRGDPIKNVEYQEINLKYIKDKLGEDYILIYKLHPWLEKVSIVDEDGIINGNKEGIRKLFSVTDYLICDYSAIIFDFSILGKPMIFYTPDLEKYKKDRGIYEDYEKIMPGPICMNEYEIVNEIKKNKNYNYEIKKFKDKYFEHQDGKSTERVAEFIKELL
ncbi:CDP-glycerol glycerophosphotransferase family protein [Clostridium sp. 1001271B_151109_B4]|uniref:CDP-glycerol glycerophosphotransferase family protein n=1 Tax=Clostridium sp. 1001271B_151109_B4 TaxID=2787148 RepID=UPI0018AB979D|nr:CDP-glycerol glycerophosphotransferase family protein [Clostridium sp. 1001271B_151109_B4]